MRATFLFAGLVLFACGRGIDPAFVLDDAGAGALAVIWHLGEADDSPDRRLIVYMPGGARELGVPSPREVRWLDRGALLVLSELPAEPGSFPETQLLRVSLDGDTRTILPPARYFNAEPSGDGRLAVGVEVNDQGESDLEIWSLGDGPTRVHKRAQNLEEPRWSPDATGLVVAMMIDPDDDAELGLSVGGIVVPWPRLFALEAALEGSPIAIRDGPRGESPVAGGSLPLWWDRSGVHARQREGLVRCATPESGCIVRYAPPVGRKLVDARPAGPGRALALMVDTEATELNRLPSEVWLLDLDAGTGRALNTARPDAFPLDLDWASGD